MRKPALFLLAAAALLRPVLAGAQPSYTLGKLEFRNSAPFKQDQLETVAGLHKGQRIGTADIQAAAQRLIDTGFFDDVGVEREGLVAALHVIFILKPLPPDHLLPVGFENFVWLTPEERTEALRKAVPLFSDALPEAGNQAELANASLGEALTAKGVSGAVVTHEIVLPSTSQPVHAVQFRIERPAVRVLTVKLAGVPAELAPAVQTAAAKLRGQPFAEGFAETTTPAQLLAPYRDAGYLQAKLTDLKTTVVKADAGTADVQVAATAESGPVYRVGSLDFSPTPVVSASAFTAGEKLRAGDVASAKLLEASEAPVDAAYRRLGYMDEFVDSGAVEDAAAHTVAYHLRVVPGEIYHLHDVRATGLNAAAHAEFDNAWGMKPGDVYNAEYVEKFVTNNSALPHLARYAGTYQAVADSNTHTVDVTIQFTPNRGTP